MLTLRRACERGHFNHGWLDTYHTFSFADYYDPDHMAFRSLRVINEDKVAAAKGFGTHPHANMEIITYILSGSLQHKDSMGNGSVIKPGDVQRMSAGTGVTHSEFNPSPTEPVHLLQIWILPEKKGITPSYEQKNFLDKIKKGQLCLVASQDGREGSVTVHQDVSLYMGLLSSGQKIEHTLKPNRHAWVQVAKGGVKVNGQTLSQGDGAAISDETKIIFEGVEEAEFLVFDLA